jgi:hypothetical protein
MSALDEFLAEVNCYDMKWFEEIGGKQATIELAKLRLDASGRYIKGGEGSHWEGCEKTHFDCKIKKLEKENAKLLADLEDAKKLINGQLADKTALDWMACHRIDAMREWLRKQEVTK